MDSYTFISKLFESLAWPITAVALVLILKSEINKLLPFIRKLKAGPLEAEFARELRDLRNDPSVQPKEIAANLKITPQQEKLLKLAEINPRSAILEAWIAVEAAVKDLTNRRSVIEARPLGESGKMDAKPELLMGSELILFRELRLLRNQAVHSEDFTPTKEATLNYIELARQLCDSLAQVKLQ